MGSLIPLFELLMMSVLHFKAREDSLAYVPCRLHAILRFTSGATPADPLFCKPASFHIFTHNKCVHSLLFARTSILVNFLIIFSYELVLFCSDWYRTINGDSFQGLRYFPIVNEKHLCNNCHPTLVSKAGDRKKYYW